LSPPFSGFRLMVRVPVMGMTTCWSSECRSSP
jgi:hypothetical protein